MAGLSKKETRALLTDLEKQGARLRKTRNGMRILGPHGRTTALHWTHSDNRSVENLRAEVRRMGYQWPFDGENRTPRNFIREEPAMSAVKNDEEIEYPGYITTMRQRPTEETLARVRGGILRLGTDEVHAATLSSLLGMNQSHVVRVLYWLGYRYDPRSKAPRPWRLIPEHDRSRTEELPLDLHLDLHVPAPKQAKPVKDDPYAEVPEHVKAAHGLTEQKHVAEPEPEEPVVEPEHEQEEPIHLEEEQDMVEEDEVPQQGEVVQVRFASNQPSVPERVATSTGEPREILDTYDSWTFPITDRLAHKTVADVMDELHGYGLQMEIRVWREG